MSIQLKLDAAALEALFPPGSEVRVELQNAVIAEFLRKNIKPSLMGGPTMAAVAKARETVTQELLKEHGVIKGTWGEYKLTPEAVNALRVEVKAAVSSIHDSVTSATAALGGTMKHDIQAALNRMVNAEIRDAVKARVQAVVNNLE